MSKFGWSYPPGCTQRMVDEAYGSEAPCDVCGQWPDNGCVCPECPECGEVGNPKCYENHGLVRTEEQTRLRAEAEAEWKADADAEAASMAQFIDEEWEWPPKKNR